MLNYGERRRAVQMEIVTTLQGTEYDVEIPHATVTRPRNGGEEPMGRWITLRGGSEGLTLVNDGPGGVEIENQTIRQTLVRSPVYCSGNDSVEPGFLGDHMDLGEHRYRFRILFGTSEAILAERQLAADDLCLPFSYHCSVPLGASVKPGLEAGSAPLVLEAVSGNGLVHLEALKVSEDGTALIMRMAERKGYRTVVRVEAHGISPVQLEFRPYEMKTMRAEKDAPGQKIPTWIECDLLEQPITTSKQA
jgi:alpha-mannosidase